MDPLPDQVNVKKTAEKIQNMIDMFIITEVDYLVDEFFKPIYQYLKKDKLTRNKEIDKKTLLLQENKCTKRWFIHLLTATFKNLHIENSKNYKK